MHPDTGGKPYDNASAKGLSIAGLAGTAEGLSIAGYLQEKPRG